MKGLLIDDDQLYASTLQRSLARKGITETVIAHESVSYTHLDVYKRQASAHVHTAHGGHADHP